jgi:hypothetical protein
MKNLNKNQETGMTKQLRARVTGCAAVVLLCSAGATPACAQSTAASTVTVPTYNIRYENPDDGENIWTNRREAMVAYVRGTIADIIGLQEVEPQQRAYLAKHLTKYAWCGVGRNPWILLQGLATESITRRRSASSSSTR